MQTAPESLLVIPFDQPDPDLIAPVSRAGANGIPDLDHTHPAELAPLRPLDVSSRKLPGASRERSSSDSRGPGHVVPLAADEWNRPSAVPGLTGHEAHVWLLELDKAPTR